MTNESTSLLEKLKKENAALHMQVRQVSRNIRIPLNDIVAVSELLKTTAIGAEQQELLRSLERAIEKMLLVVERLGIETSTPSEHETATSVASSDRAGNYPHLLLVDDNETNLTFTALLLQRRGYQVETAASGHAALEKFTGGACQVVLLDLQMPDMSGFEVLREIRRRDAETGTHTRVISLSAQLGAITGNSGGHSFDGSLSKPIHIDKLVAVLEALEPSVQS